MRRAATGAALALALVLWATVLVLSIRKSGLDCPPTTSAPADAYGYGWEPC